MACYIFELPRQKRAIAQDISETSHWYRVLRTTVLSAVCDTRFTFFAKSKLLPGSCRDKEDGEVCCDMDSTELVLACTWVAISATGGGPLFRYPRIISVREARVTPCFPKPYREDGAGEIDFASSSSLGEDPPEFDALGAHPSGHGG